MSKQRAERTAEAGTKHAVPVFAVSEWPLRRKLALVLTIPMVLAAVFGSLRVWDGVRDQRAYVATQSQLTVLEPLVDYLHAAQEAAVIARATEPGAPERGAALEQVQASAAAVANARAEADLTSDQSALVDRIMAQSAPLREETGYSSIVSSLTQVRGLYAGVNGFFTLLVNDQLEPEPTLPQLTFVLGARLAFTVQQLQVDREGGKVLNAYDVYADLGVEDAALDQLIAARGESDLNLRDLSIENERRLGRVRAGSVDLPYEANFDRYDTLTDDVFQGVEQNLDEFADAALRSAGITAAVTALALLLASLLALVVSRLLVNPVRRVRDGALAVANEQLPEAVAQIRAGREPAEIVPIDVTTHEEMGQLARAVDDMHRTAVRLASGEAKLRAQVGEMFVTLSRRNTSLINQQLGLIEELEHDEQDPRRLESLFRLDHLAARMRRTAESLVILSDAPVRSRADAALSVADAVQAASAGVQEYQRVQLVGAPQESIVGSAANDVVHLLTEVIDNALSFSPPSTSVEVDASASVREAVIRISDAGLGMPADTLAEVNDMLRSGAEMTPDATRRMGLFVVSRLARRHGITVVLDQNIRGGITATISLPATLLASGAAAAERAAEEAALAAAAAAPAAPVPTAAPMAAPEPITANGELQVDRIMAAINAVTGLPQRRPGSTSIDRQEVVEPFAVGQAPLQAPTVAATPAASYGEQPPTQPAFAQPAAAQSPHPGSYDAPTAPAAPMAPVPAASASRTEDALGGILDRDTPAPHDNEEESPIFAQLQSNWLSSSSGGSWANPEVDAGWQSVERIAEVPAASITDSGLPKRRPGTRLVPGGVTTAGSHASRDPEAIRAKLAAHAAGVNKGRRAAVTSISPHEEAGPA